MAHPVGLGLFVAKMRRGWAMLGLVLVGRVVGDSRFIRQKARPFGEATIASCGLASVVLNFCFQEFLAVF